MRGRAGHARAGAAYAGFAVFGGFWGTWGASIPAIRDQAGITVGELGTALLFIGAGALPAMLLSGRIVDHWGQRAAAGLLLLLGFIGVLVGSTARDLTSLSAGLAALGAASGAADVAINTAAGSAQQVSSRNVITRAHAIFSLGVVVASLLAGALHQLGAPLMAPFILLAGASAITAVTLAATAPRRVDLRHDVPRSPGLGQRRLSPVLAPLLVLGALGAVALAVENGQPELERAVPAGCPARRPGGCRRRTGRLRRDRRPHPPGGQPVERRPRGSRPSHWLGHRRRRNRPGRGGIDGPLGASRVWHCRRGHRRAVPHHPRRPQRPGT